MGTSRLGLTSTMAGTLESEEEETLPPTAEELEELRKDQLNITLDVLHPGTRKLQNCLVY